MPRPLPVFVASLVIAAAAGFGVGAIFLGSGNEGSTTTAVTRVDTRPISLPVSLAGFRDLVDALSNKGASSSTLQQQRSNQAKVRRATEDAYRRAFGGAGAAYRAYGDSALMKFPYVIAVRGAAPGLTIGPVPDPSYLGLAAPPRQVETVGQVSCQINWSPPTVAGQRPAPSSEVTTACQRTGPQLTVFVGGGGFSGPADLQTMVDLTNAAWTSVSGS